jgi:iron complex transport system substrate-binding protein
MAHAGLFFMKIKTLILYSTLTLFIFSWWFAAFRPSPQKMCAPFDFDLKKQLDPNFFPSQLSLLDRSEILQALNGDLSLMVKCIAEWDLDGEILESHGLAGIKKLPKEALVRAKLLGRLFQHISQAELHALQNDYRLKGIIDDNGSLIPLKEPFQLFLPQTHVAAAFLLALTDPSQIVAIPKGIREQTSLYSPQLTRQIRHDIDRYNGEHFFQVKPQVAFVSHYSHPSSLQALQNQGVQLFSLNTIETLPDIRHALIRVGNVINRPFEAELLTIFMEAAMLAIDNRLSFIDHGTLKPRLLYLNYRTQFSAPSSKTLTWQLLERLGHQSCLPQSVVEAHADDWSIPMDQEQIVNYNPDCLIFATADGESSANQILETFAFQKLTALANKNVFFVDEAIQQSPTQFIVLAYYDLADALSHNRLNDLQLTNPQLLSTIKP